MPVPRPLVGPKIKSWNCFGPISAFSQFSFRLVGSFSGRGPRTDFAVLPNRRSGGPNWVMRRPGCLRAPGGAVGALRAGNAAFRCAKRAGKIQVLGPNSTGKLSLWGTLAREARWDLYGGQHYFYVPFLFPGGWLVAFLAAAPICFWPIPDFLCILFHLGWLVGSFSGRGPDGKLTIKIACPYVDIGNPG